MSTVNSQNLDARVVAITATPVRKTAVDKPAIDPSTVSKTTEAASSGQQSAVGGNSSSATPLPGDSSQGSVEEAITRINNFVQQIQRDLQFSVDDESGRTVIKVIDSESKEVIRQIPEEVLLKVARSIEDSLEGTLLEVKV